MQFFDTHCHIHEADSVYGGTTESREKWLRGGITAAEPLVAQARADSVTRMVCVGTTLEDSRHAIKFVAGQDGLWASIGIHPHEAQHYEGNAAKWQAFANLASRPKVVAVGECGLDYFYEHSPRKAQMRIIEQQIDLALQHDLAMIFHVRDAFDDFWPIFDNFAGIRGVIHSFTADRTVLEQALSRDLYIGLNGIMTFTKDDEQLSAAKMVPTDRLVLETDAPFLTPAPYRGKICTPSHVAVTGQFLASIRNESIETLSDATTENARQLFRIS